jgi:hypothetical protein
VFSKIDSVIRRSGAAALLYTSLAIVQPTVADGLRIIELNDGSRITGEVVGFDNGMYTIQSNTLGQLHIPDGSIRAIRSWAPGSDPENAASAPLIGSSTGAQIAELQARILNDPNILTIVMSLQNDPQVLSILNDPEIMRAIAAWDLESLQNSSRILDLERHQKIQQLLQLLGAR